MSQSAQVPGGVVTSLQGRANVMPAGQTDARPLQEGDAIQPGDVILAEANAQLQITDADGQAWMPRDMPLALAGANGKAAEVKQHTHDKADHVDDNKAVDDAISAINAVDRGDEDAATAAGLTGGGGGSMSLGLRVDRVIETVSPQEFAYSTPDREAGTPIATVANVLTAPQSATPAPAVDEPADKPNHHNHPPKVYDPDSGNFDPVTGYYELTTNQNKPVSGQVKATDPDGDALTYAKDAGPAHGAVVVHDDGTWTYTPAKDYNGADSFTVTVSDGHGGTATATINIGINPVNDPPKVYDPDSENFDPVTGYYELTTNQDKPVSGQVKATDADGDALSYAKGADPVHGAVLVHEDGSWTYTPTKGYSGTDTFTVTVSDGHGDTPTATINVGINPVMDTLLMASQSSPSATPADHIEHTVSGRGEHQGTADTDVFAWTLADRPAQGESQIDTITDFNSAARAAGGDVLDLRDLLQTAPGATTSGTGGVDNLLHFLDFDTHSQPGSTIIHVSASGSFQADATGQSNSTGCADQQHIVLANVDLRSSMGLDQSANDHQIISELMNRGKLLVDHS